MMTEIRFHATWNGSSNKRRKELEMNNSGKTSF
jgi:hypothetical protein